MCHSRPRVSPSRGSRRKCLSRGIAETHKVRDFCTEQRVTPEIEPIEPDYFNDADRRVGCRFVIPARYAEWVVSVVWVVSAVPTVLAASTPASGQPAAASFAATLRTFSAVAS